MIPRNIALDHKKRWLTWYLLLPIFCDLAGCLGFKEKTGLDLTLLGKFINFALIKPVPYSRSKVITAPLLLLAILPFLFCDKLPTLWPLIIHQGNRLLLCRTEGEVYYRLIFNCKGWHIVSGTNKSEQLTYLMFKQFWASFTRTLWKAVCKGWYSALTGRYPGCEAMTWVSSPRNEDGIFSSKEWDIC